jgi:hypothetical protein
VASSPKNFLFAAKKRDCYKCEIFVARVYSCYKAFSVKGGIDDALLAKVKKCLEIMESRLPDSVSTKKKRKSAEKKQVLEESSLSDPASTKKKRKSAEKKQAVDEPPLEDPAQPPTKRKRGRPPKSNGAAKEQDAAAAEMGSPMNESVEEQVEHVRSSSRVAPRVAPRVARRSTNNGKIQTLSQLVARFEDQYNQMGARYQEMGETLTALKSKIDDNRDTTEKEIRNELLQEVQKTIMSSFPKK